MLSLEAPPAIEEQVIATGQVIVTGHTLPTTLQFYLTWKPAHQQQDEDPPYLPCMPGPSSQMGLPFRDPTAVAGTVSEAGVVAGIAAEVGAAAGTVAEVGAAAGTVAEVGAAAGMTAEVGVAAGMVAEVGAAAGMAVAGGGGSGRVLALFCSDPWL